MGIRKSLLLSGGLLTIAALLGATTASAAVPSFCTTANFRVDAVMNTANGLTSYQYAMSNVNGSTKNANKLFVYSAKGLEGDLLGTIPGSTSVGTYVTNGTTAASNCPPTGAWTFNEHQDGMCFTSVAMQNKPTLTVSARDRSEEGATSVLLTYANTTESCGPILGPTTLAAPSFLGSPIVSRTVRQVLPDGCAYILTLDTTTDVVTGGTLDPSTPLNTDGDLCGGMYDVPPGTCELETGAAFCAPVRGGGPPSSFLTVDLVGGGANIATTCVSPKLHYTNYYPPSTTQHYCK
jgi:hypothetical protein